MEVVIKDDPCTAMVALSFVSEQSDERVIHRPTDAPAVWYAERIDPFGTELLRPSLTLPRDAFECLCDTIRARDGTPDSELVRRLKLEESRVDKFIDAALRQGT